MLLQLFFLCHLTVTFGNPFHKYPYVFLLDIGNEELQTTSEQIRVSIPGGSLALRYPAIGEGDTIAHVRVSGIDFGTDLKANIVDGGPGSKYVVIVFMGNPGEAYDAVVTVSTVVDENTETANASSDTEAKDTYEVPEDSESQDRNDSAETAEEDDKKSDEPVPSASNFYDSAENGELNGKEDVNDKDIQVHDERSKDSQNDAVEDYVETDEQSEDSKSVYSKEPKAQHSYINDEHELSQDNDEREMSRKLYDKYDAVRSRLYDRVQDYPQEVNEAANEVGDDGDDDEAYSPKDPSELDQMFNDEEVHTDGEKYADSNNNYNDADNSAVAY